MADIGNQFNVREKHTGADIAVLTKLFWDATEDSSEDISELVSGIYDFYLSISTLKDKKFSIKNIVPPDEYAIGRFIQGKYIYEGVDDSVFTNAAVSETCQFASRISETLGINNDKIDDWKEFADNLVILEADGPNGSYHPEYDGFPKGNFNKKVK